MPGGPPTLTENCDVMKTQGGPCNACLESWSTGATIDGPGFTTGEQAVCPVTDLGVQAPSCSGMTLVGVFGSACRAACDRDPSCASRAKAYCDTTEGKANYDCSCLEPSGRTWGQGDSEVSYDSQEHFIRSQGLNFDARCVWPPCAPGRKETILQDPSLDCPDTALQCSVSNVSFTLQDIQSGNVQLIDQNCGSVSNVSKKTSGAKNIIFGWTQTQVAWGVAVLLAFLVIPVVAFAVWWRSRSALRAEKAAARARSTTTHTQRM